MAAKKALVIGLMSVLMLSVIVGAVSFYTRSSPPSNSIATNEEDFNKKINRVVDFCINSLPNGTVQCDNLLRNAIDKVCTTDNKLDACQDGRVDQYYHVRAQVKTSQNGTTNAK